jgi:4-hydroxybenzoate polyprenyltransferase
MMDHNRPPQDKERARAMPSRPAPRPADPIGLFLDSIKFSHSVFALPFALVSMLLAAGGWPSFWTVLWIIVACVAARTAAMSFNRLVDREFDARNPRTAGRPTVTGAVPPALMVRALLISAGVFILAALMLNRTCFYLSVPVLAVLLGYSLAKRFTSWSHFILGVALGLAPLGAWVAVTGGIDLLPVVLSAAVIAWVAGFDLLYACQDAEFDAREPDLHSMPKQLGIAGAMTLARRSHAAAFALFLLFWWLSPLGLIALLGILAAGALMVWQHRLVSPTDLSRIDAAFFTANGLVAMGLFLFVLLDMAV